MDETAARPPHASEGTERASTPDAVDRRVLDGGAHAGGVPDRDDAWESGILFSAAAITARYDFIAAADQLSNIAVHLPSIAARHRRNGGSQPCPDTDRDTGPGSAAEPDAAADSVVPANAASLAQGDSLHVAPTAVPDRDADARVRNAGTGQYVFGWHDRDGNAYAIDTNSLICLSRPCPRDTGTGLHWTCRPDARSPAEPPDIEVYE